MGIKEHWNERYNSRDDAQLSWTESEPQQVIDWIKQCAHRSDAVVDIGAGRSRLLEKLLELGYEKLTHLELSDVASTEMRKRLETSAQKIEWVCSNVLDWRPQQSFHLWHDRAVFHFLTEVSDRKSYIEVLESCLEPDGCVIISTFHTSGPEKCSGLPICQYTPEELLETCNHLGKRAWTLSNQALHAHQTPSGAIQQFQYSCFKVATSSE
jgi:2-polyprenyl-3-methyl-5-hydroxy-6-metoxy-1,4-benzoquinol methylase